MKAQELIEEMKQKESIENLIFILNDIEMMKILTMIPIAKPIKINCHEEMEYENYDDLLFNLTIWIEREFSGMFSHLDYCENKIMEALRYRLVYPDNTINSLVLSAIRNKMKGAFDIGEV